MNNVSFAVLCAVSLTILPIVGLVIKTLGYKVIDKVNNKPEKNYLPYVLPNTIKNKEIKKAYKLTGMDCIFK